MSAARPTRDAGAAGPGTTPQHALDGLRRAIVAGELRPGAAGRARRRSPSASGVSVAPVREALRVLEQEGQVTYLPRRGYFVTELRSTTCAEIYELRAAARGAGGARARCRLLDDDALRADRAGGARLRRRGRRPATSPPSWRPTAASTSAILDSPDQPHTLRADPAALGLDRGLPRALLQLAGRARARRSTRTTASSPRSRARDADRLVAELDAHRGKRARRLAGILAPASEARGSGVEEDVELEVGLGAAVAVAAEVGDALLGEHLVVDEEVAGASRLGRAKIA